MKYLHLKKIIRFLINTVIRVLVSILVFFEVLFFLVRNHSVFKNELINIFYHRSFGHQISSYEWTSRLFWPNKISFIEILMPGNNRYLSNCYKNFDVFSCKFLFYKNKPVHGAILYEQLKFFMSLICTITNKNLLIDTRLVYKTLSIPSSSIFAGNDAADKKVVYNSVSGFFRLLKDKVGPVTKLSENCKRDIEGAIKKCNPNFLNKPFVTILIRNKESASPYWISHIRNPKTQDAYIRSVKYITSSGYNVLGVGEINIDLFKGIHGFYSLEDFKLDYGLLNLYALSECSYFIGQHSGPVNYVDSAAIPVLLTDVMPIWQGTANSNDLLLYKVFIEKATGKELSILDICEKHKDLVYGINLSSYIVRDNSELEILNSVKDLIHGITNPDYEQLLSKFHQKLPLDTLAYFTKNRVPDCVLTNSLENI